MSILSCCQLKYTDKINHSLHDNSSKNESYYILNHALFKLCNEVFNAWENATPEKPIIFNLPATVERRLPNQYADMIELSLYFNYFFRQSCHHQKCIM